MKGLSTFCLVAVMYGAAINAPRMMAPHPATPTTSLLSYWECWFFPFAWCTPVDPPSLKPKILQPDVPECGTFVGPCQY